MSLIQPDPSKKFLVLVQDPDSKNWSIVLDSVYEVQADRLLKNMRDTKDPSPAIKIDTSDYVTINENPPS